MDDIFKNGGYFDDDGTPLNPDLIPKPGLCMICALDNDPTEEMLCNLNRLDQRNESDFKCFAFKKLE